MMPPPSCWSPPPHPPPPLRAVALVRVAARGGASPPKPPPLRRPRRTASGARTADAVGEGGQAGDLGVQGGEPVRPALDLRHLLTVGERQAALHHRLHAAEGGGWEGLHIHLCLPVIAFSRRGQRVHDGHERGRRQLPGTQVACQTRFLMVIHLDRAERGGACVDTIGAGHGGGANANKVGTGSSERGEPLADLAHRHDHRVGGGGPVKVRVQHPIRVGAAAAATATATAAAATPTATAATAATVTHPAATATAASAAASAERWAPATPWRRPTTNAKAGGEPAAPVAAVHGRKEGERGGVGGRKRGGSWA